MYNYQLNRHNVGINKLAHLQNLASIQPRTSPVKFARSSNAARRPAPLNTAQVTNHPSPPLGPLSTALVTVTGASIPAAARDVSKFDLRSELET